MTIEPEKEVFEDLVAILVSSENDVTEGPMMSSPGIRYKNKVFAFYYDQQMVFRLGKGYEISKLGVKNYSFLNPFKNKPPMKGWFVVPATEINKWSKLAQQALENMK